MQLRIGAQRPDGAADQSDDDQRDAGGQHHGQQAHGQHPAFWNVHQPRQPDSSLRNFGCCGCLDTDALHTRDSGTLGHRITDSHTRQHASAEQYF